MYFKFFIGNLSNYRLDLITGIKSLFFSSFSELIDRLLFDYLANVLIISEINSNFSSKNIKKIDTSFNMLSLYLFEI